MNVPTSDISTDRSERYLQTLLKVSRAIGTVLDTHALMRRIIDCVADAFSADRASLYLHDPVRSELWIHSAQGLAQRQIRVADTRGIVGHVHHSGESVCIADTLADPHFDRETAERFGYVPRSMVVVPVLHRAPEKLGVLQVMDQRPGHFTPADLPLVQAVAVQVAISLENARLHAAQRKQFDSFVKAFTTALEARDPSTATHSVNVANYAMGIALHLGLDADDIEWLRIAGLLHDIGKIGVPEAILTKPGRLTDDEFDKMKAHAAHSRRILAQIEFVPELLGMEFIAAAHHEKLDGSGYPDGLTGDNIPLKSRILTVADIFDALTQKRHYREPGSIHDALAIIDKMTPHQLDPSCVAALRRYLNAASL
jgi:putative nucleotidyltransferase with HDIG domain